MRCKGFELLPWLAAGLVWIVSACQPEAPTGAVQLLGRLEQALSASDVTRVAVTVSAPDMAPLTTELLKTDGQWSGRLGRIPAGAERTFTAEAFGSDGTKLYAGQVTGIPILPGKTALVALTLQQVGAPPPFTNAVPVIDALVSSASGVSSGERVTLGVTAHDPNASDSLTYTWTASAGVLGSASSPTTTWTAPEATGPVLLTVTVTDPQGSSATLSLSLTVRGARGSADLEVSLNTWPQVARIVATPSRVNVGEPTRVVATATDNDGDALSYAWSASGCTGSWTEASSATARFTPDSVPAGGSCACRLEVTAADGRGGQARGTLAICVGAAATPLFAPEVVSTFQSATSVPTDGRVSLRVEAEDPQGSALGFTWSASTGALGTPTSTANRSEVGWTAPGCSSRGSATLTVTVRNAHGLTTSTEFTVRGIPDCLRSGTWSAVGSFSRGRNFHTATLLPSGQVLMVGSENGPPDLFSEEVFDPETGLSTLVGPEGPASRRRHGHTATLLPSGRVLVVGGMGSNQVELFDSVSWTWSPGSSLAETRWGHTATLLPSGKVLITGGLSPSQAPIAKAELYDPETGTWSPTAPLSAVRAFHTATLLPTGKVLVTGGAGENEIPHETAELYDPEAGTWAPTGTMSLKRFQHTATLLPSGRVLVTAGGSSYKEAEVYDPRTETWSSAGSLSMEGRSRAATLLPSGKVLVVGSGSAELYDPGTGTWGPAGTLETAHGTPTATLLPSGKVLVTAGGYSRLVELYDPESGGWTPYGSKDECFGLLKTLPTGKVLVLCGDDRARLYEPVTRSWSVTGSLHTARNRPSVTLLPTGRVLVAGGSATDGTPLATAELYDPETGMWLPTGAMSVSRDKHSALSLPSGKVLVLGGDSPVVEVYDPNEGTWVALGHLPLGRASFSAVLLTTGKVLLVGGFSAQAQGPVHHADVFDPETGTWALTSSMTGILLHPMATVLPSGKVLGLGLEVEWGSQRAEVYDPETGTWALTSPMTGDLRFPTATVLPSGKVLVVGSGIPLAKAGLYDPVTGSWVPAGELGTYFVHHTATRLSSGQVLVLGGGESFFTKTLLYNP